MSPQDEIFLFAIARAVEFARVHTGLAIIFPSANARSEITVSRPFEREFESGKQDAGNLFKLESIPAFLSSLEILLRPGVDAIECFLDVLDRVRHTEAKITLAEVAERGAGQCSDTCVIEERVGQLFRWPSSLS
jgi:hypothetical protein